MHGYGDGGGGRCIFSVYFRMECRHAVGLFLPRIKNIYKERVRKRERKRRTMYHWQQEISY